MKKTILSIAALFLITLNTAQAVSVNPQPRLTVDQIIKKYPVGVSFSKQDAEIIKASLSKPKVAGIGIFESKYYIRWAGVNNLNNYFKSNLLTLTGNSFISINPIGGSTSVSANVNVNSTNIRNKVTTPRSLKINYSYVAFGLVGRNGFGKVVDLNLSHTCKNTTSCNLSSGRAYDAIIAYSKSYLYAEAEYSNGIYNIHANGWEVK